MKVIEIGHHYELECYDVGDRVWIKDDIFFMKRVGGHYPGNKGEPHPGTNCQEVLRVLINRIKYLDRQIPCDENKIIIQDLRNALLLFEQRAARMHGRTLSKRFFLNDPKLIKRVEIEDEPTCKTCGHIECTIKEHNNDIQRLSEGCEVNTSIS
jgi:hypothetical protein